MSHNLKEYIMDGVSLFWIYYGGLTFIYAAVLLLLADSYKVRNEKVSHDLMMSCLWLTPVVPLLLPMLLIMAVVVGSIYGLFVWLPEKLSSESTWMKKPEQLELFPKEKDITIKDKSTEQPTEKTKKTYEVMGPINQTKKKETIKPAVPKPIEVEAGKKPSFKEAFELDDKDRKIEIQTVADYYNQWDGSDC